MTTATTKSSHPFVVLGVAGGIAAYKSVELLRLLREAGYHVAPVLTSDAANFVGPLTFSALASEPARTSLYGDAVTPSPHTYLGQAADVIVVAPATAHLIARLAGGLANDLLTATIWASRAPVILCPAMHTEMWEQSVVQENLATLRRRGVLVMEPEVGELAGGDIGKGRLPSPEKIFDLVNAVTRGFHGPLTGQRVLVSAGGTIEAIDPVRVLSNRSSGRQGHAMAEVAARWGAEVTLVTASPLELSLDVTKSIRRIQVESAYEMHTSMMSQATTADIVVMAAAVADFTVAKHDQKLKKRDGTPTLKLTETVDILVDLVQHRPSGQRIVGFAAETDNVEINAVEKLQRKGVDFLVVNDVSQDGVGFNHETNEVVIYDRNGGREALPPGPKASVAAAIWTRILTNTTKGKS
jgi:phosphopantothenoylcysteine decarboxylase / phosphopantothenate---cysteine ligase